MKTKKIFFIVSIFIIIIIFFIIFFSKNMANIFKTGNNNTSQTIVNDILNIKSYELKAEIEIKSNKNENNYIIKQKYISPEYNSQEVIEPENIKGVIIEREGNKLKIQNTKLNLTTMFNNYEYLSENVLDLSSFIQECKNEDYKQKENSNEITLEISSKTANPYIVKKILYIDKKTAKPTKMEIKDNNQKAEIHILYTEVKINNL